MSECYRKYKDTTHLHVGPTFSRCSKCKRIICDDCISKHLSANQVVCVECAQTLISRQYNRIREQPWKERRERSITLIRVTTSGIIWFFGGLTSSIYRFFRYMTKPFRPDSYQYQSSRGKYEVDFLWTDYKDKVRFAFISIGGALAIAILALVYAGVREIPLPRALVAFSGTIIFWGILAIYLQYFFDPALPRPISQIVAYSSSFFLAILFGVWLINREFIDTIFAALGFR